MHSNLALKIGLVDACGYLEAHTRLARRSTRKSLNRTIAVKKWIAVDQTWGNLIINFRIYTNAVE